MSDDLVKKRVVESLNQSVWRSVRGVMEGFGLKMPGDAGLLTQAGHRSIPLPGYAVAETLGFFGHVFNVESGDLDDNTVAEVGTRLNALFALGFVYGFIAAKEEGQYGSENPN